METVRSALSIDPVFPNPASTLTCIPVQASGDEEAVIEIADVFGRTVHTVFSGTLPNGVSRYYFFANQFPAGVYYVVLKSKDTILTQKVIVK